MQKRTLNEFYSDLKANLVNENFLDCIDLLTLAIEEYPKEYKLKLNLGNIYKMLGQMDNAINIYTELLSTSLKNIAHNNLSAIMLETGQLEKSIDHARNALRDNDDYYDAKYNLAVGLFENKSYMESLNICENLLNVESYENKAYELKIRIKQIICDWNDYLKTENILKKNKIFVHPFLHISCISNESSNYTNAKAWNKNNESLKLNKSPLPMPSKVRMGFLCGEIRNHPTFHLIKNFFKNINKDIFSIYMFSYGHETDKKLLIENDFNEFVDISQLNTTESVSKVKSYDLEILIDLTTIISYNRSQIVNQGVAKIIISYLAYPGTTGNHAYDYILTDKVVTPKEQQKYYTEQFMYLPKSYQINNGEINTDITNKRSDFNLPEGFIILGCLNQSFKLDPVFFDIWINVLQRYDNTCLWLLDYGDEMRKNINNFIDNRIESERIIYADRIEYELHLERIQHIDIALDTRIYNGHTTTIEMIQAGIPLITYKGNHFASRVSASILNNLELELFITDSHEEYEEKIISLIDEETRISHKNLIKKKINTSNLLNIKNFTNDFEQAILKCFK